MQTIILYGSQYGTTKRYADRLAEQTGRPSAMRTGLRSRPACQLLVMNLPETFPGTRKLFIWEGCMRAA